MLVFDVETQKSFREVQNETKKLRISIAVAYDYKTEKIHSFDEQSIGGLFALFEKASVIVGFNSNSFDLVVLSPYYVGDLFQFVRFDLLENIKERIGRRYSLDDLVNATLNKGKSGHGLKALEFFREGKMQELIQYCTDDVLLTKELFDFGIKNGFVYAPNGTNKTKILVNWRTEVGKKTTSKSNHNLTLGF